MNVSMPPCDVAVYNCFPSLPSWDHAAEAKLPCSCGFLVPQCLHTVIYLNPPCSRIIIFNSRAKVLPSRQLEWCSKPFKFSRRAAVVFIFRVRVKSCVIVLQNSGVTSLVSLLLKAVVWICCVIKVGTRLRGTSRPLMQANLIRGSQCVLIDLNG